MAKRRSGAPASERDERTLRLKRGDKIEFPVSAKHPLAKFQTLTPVRSPDDIRGFLRAWEEVAAAQDQPPVTPADLVAQLKKEKISVLRISSLHLRIADRAVVTLNNPLNQLDADSITIAGTLVSRGDLVVTCKTLTME
jgi:hypothetical protein